MPVSMLTKFIKLPDVRPEERRLVFLLVLHSFFIGLAQVLQRTTSMTLFLEHYSAQVMPYVYIGSAVAGPLTGLLYARIEKRTSFTRLLVSTLVFLLLVQIAFRGLIFALPGAGWPAFAFNIWYFVQEMLIGLQFWALTGRVLNLRQGKRLFGLVGSGDFVARIVGGFSVSALVAMVGTVNLIFLSIAGVAICLALLVYTCRFQPVENTRGETTSSQDEEEHSYRELFKARYIYFLIALSTFTLICFYFVDQNFVVQTRRVYTESQALAGFLGRFQAWVNITCLFSGIFLAGPLISRFGVTAGLIVLPAVTALGTLGSVVLGSLPAYTGLVFWPVALTRLLFMVFRKSTQKTAAQILLQPLPATTRIRTQTVLESVIEPAASGVAGLLLLALLAGGSFFNYILLLLVAAWIICVFLTNQAYIQALTAALSGRTIRQFSFDWMDAGSRDLIRQGLASPYPGEVIYFLDLLENSGHETVGASLKSLISHPEPAVRGDVLRRIERLGLSTYLPRVRNRVRLEAHPQVKGAGLRALAALSGSESIDLITPFLKSKDSQVRMGAMIGLLRYGGIQGVQAAGETVISQARSPDPQHRLLAAQVLGESGLPHFYEPLIPLLHDQDTGVRQAALSAAAKLHHPRLWPVVIQNLCLPGLRTSAAASLAAGGEESLPYLIAAFQEPGQSKKLRLRLVEVCGKIGGAAAITFLQELIAAPDVEVSDVAILALQACAYTAQGEEAAQMLDHLRREGAAISWTLAAQQDLAALLTTSPDGSYTLLKAALEYKLARHIEHIFGLLTFIYNPKVIRRAHRLLASAESSNAQRAVALEMLDVLVAPDIRRFLLPLLDKQLSAALRLRRLSEHFPQRQYDATGRLQEIIHRCNQRQSPTPAVSVWLKACALAAIMELDTPAFDACVAELKKNPDNEARRILAWTEKPRSEGKTMLSTFEKVIILKTVSIFSETPEEVLADLADNFREIHAEAGELLLTAGDVAKSFNIIISGEVCLQNGDQMLLRLFNRDIFGELSGLEAGPQLENVFAITDVHFLRLSQELFEELLADRNEVARGLLRVLARRLRAALLERPEALVEAPEVAKDDVMQGIYRNLVEE